MIGNVCMDLSLANIWRSWYLFCRGKKQTQELREFKYDLEKNIFSLYQDLNSGLYKHGGYSKFIVKDNKRREISVASIRDRIVHRLIYEYLVFLYDKTFIFDVWSCRKNKGLLGAINRAQYFLSKHSSNGFVWRADIKKFFDTVSQQKLLEILDRKVLDLEAKNLLRHIITGYNSAGIERERERERESKASSIFIGIPIGNLTSQIFANIYLNELDRYVKHSLRISGYLRYGDDFLVIVDNFQELEGIRLKIRNFIATELKLNINTKNDILLKAKDGVHFLGVDIFSGKRRLKKRNWRRACQRLSSKNSASYLGLVNQHCNYKRKKEFNWLIKEKLNI